MGAGLNSACSSEARFDSRYSRSRAAFGFCFFLAEAHERAGDVEQPAVEGQAVLDQLLVEVDAAPGLDRRGDVVPSPAAVACQPRIGLHGAAERRLVGDFLVHQLRVFSPPSRPTWAFREFCMPSRRSLVRRAFSWLRWL